MNNCPIPDLTQLTHVTLSYQNDVTDHQRAIQEELRKTVEASHQNPLVLTKGDSSTATPAKEASIKQTQSFGMSKLFPKEEAKKQFEQIKPFRLSGPVLASKAHHMKQMNTISFQASGDSSFQTHSRAKRADSKPDRSPAGSDDGVHEIPTENIDAYSSRQLISERPIVAQTSPSPNSRQIAMHRATVRLQSSGQKEYPSFLSNFSKQNHRAKNS